MCGEGDQHAAAIVGIVFTPDIALGFEAIDETGDSATGETGEQGELPGGDGSGAVQDAESQKIADIEIGGFCGGLGVEHGGGAHPAAAPEGEAQQVSEMLVRRFMGGGIGTGHRSCPRMQVVLSNLENGAARERDIGTLVERSSKRFAIAKV